MDNKKIISPQYLIFLSSLGGAFEMYDFMLYLFMLPFLREVFFPFKDSFLSTLSVFAVFALGYLIRPLGGLIFGHFGDRIGRKNMFVCSILLMTAPIFLLGLLPSVSTIGITASLLFIMLRILQGLAVGGEIPGAMTFTYEYVPEKNRGLAGGGIFAGLNYGLTFASLLSVGLSTVFNSQEMQLWGWRIPFILGGIFGVIAVILRLRTKESPVFLELKAKNLLEKLPLASLLKTARLSVCRGILLTALGSMVLIIGFAYIKPYLTLTLHYSSNSEWWLVLASFLSATLQIFFGWLSDHINRVRLLSYGSCLCILLGYPIFKLFTLHVMWAFLLGLSGLILLGGLVIGVYPCLVVELFSPAVRYTGYGFSYNIAFALIGSLVPLTLTYFLQITPYLTLPGIYLIAGGFCGLLGLTGLKKPGKCRGLRCANKMDNP